MTKEGRLIRGKENYDRKIFLDNPETLEYIATLSKTSKKEEIKEAENVKSDK